MPYARARFGGMTDSRAMTLLMLVCGLAAALAQRPLPPALPCGWEAAWNETLHAYSYRNVFTDETASLPPTPGASSAAAGSRNERGCPAAFALGPYGMYPWSRPDLPWTQGLSTGFADETASWIWNEPGAGLSARAGEVVRFYKFIDRDRLMERDAPSHRALLHIIADGDTACTVRFNNATLGVFTGGYDNKNYTKYAVDLSQGLNLIEVEATNAAGPAGLMLALLSASDGRVLAHSDATWSYVSDGCRYCPPGIVINGSDSCGIFDCDSGDITSTCVISSRKQLPGHLCLDGRELGALVLTAGGSIECSPSFPSCRVDIAMRSIHVTGTLEASQVQLRANVKMEVSGVISATGPLETYNSDCTDLWPPWGSSVGSSYRGYRMCSGAGGGHSALGGNAGAYATSSSYTVPRLGSSRPLNIEAVVQPSIMGGSGGRGAYWDGHRYLWTDGGTGGGRIQIFTSSLMLTGRIAADGKQPSSSSCSSTYACTSSACRGDSTTASKCDACHCGGGGAGGSISIEAQNLQGELGGRISCNGADAKGHGGAGAGGKIALRYEFISDSLVLEAHGGRAMSPARSGGAGSIAHIVASTLSRVEILSNVGDALGAPLALNFSSQTIALRVQRAHVNLLSDVLFQTIDFNHSTVRTSDAITVHARGIRMEKSSVIAAGNLSLFTTENFTMLSSSSISGPNMNLSVTAGLDFIMSSSILSLAGSTETVRISTGAAFSMSSSSSMSLTGSRPVLSIVTGTDLIMSSSSMRLTGSSAVLSMVTGTDLIMSSLSSITGSESAVSISTGRNLMMSSSSSISGLNMTLSVTAGVDFVMLSPPPPTDTGSEETEGNSQLPVGWQAVWDEEYQRYYYYNAATGEATWDKPPYSPPPNLPPSIVARNISIYVDGTFHVCNLEALNIEANATTILQGRSDCRISASGKVTTRVNRTAGRDCCGQACDDGRSPPTFDSTNFAGAGGGNGGEGGGCGRNGWGGGLVSGDINDPWEYGGRGGDGAVARQSPSTYKCPTGGNGGGRIRLSARDALQISGIVEADGSAPADCGEGGQRVSCSNSYCYNSYLPSAAGGGAGGSIQLRAGHLHGSGLVSANGGAGGRITYGSSDPVYSSTYLQASRSGGGGGGGRIAASFSSLSKGVRFEAKGGTSSGGDQGSHGTRDSWRPRDLMRGSGGSVALLAHADEALYTFFNCTFEKSQNVKAATLRSPFSLSLTEQANVTIEGATSVGRIVLSQFSRLVLHPASSGLLQSKLVVSQMVMQAQSVFEASDYAIRVETSLLACNVSASSLEVGTNLMLTETQTRFADQPCSIISNQIAVGQSIIAPYRSLIASHAGMSLSVTSESLLASRISSEKSILANITDTFELDGSISSVRATDDVRIMARAMTMPQTSRIVAGSLVALHISADLQSSHISCGVSSLKVGGSLYMWSDASLATQRMTKWEIAGDVSVVGSYLSCNISSAQDAITVVARQVEFPCGLSAHRMINIVTSGTFMTAGDISTPILNVSSSGTSFRDNLIKSQNVLLNVEGLVSLADVVMQGDQSGVEANLFQLSGQCVRVQSAVFSNVQTVSIHSQQNVSVEDSSIFCGHLSAVANEMVILRSDSHINAHTALVRASSVAVSKSQVSSANLDISVIGSWSIQESTIASTQVVINASSCLVIDSTISSVTTVINASNDFVNDIVAERTSSLYRIFLLGGGISSHTIQLQADGAILVLNNHQIQATAKVEAQGLRFVANSSSIQCTARYCFVHISSGEIELKHRASVRGSNIQLEATTINVLSECAQGEGALESCASHVTTSGQGEPSDQGEGAGGDSCGHSVLSVAWQGGGGGAHGGAGADCCFEHGGHGVPYGDAQGPWTYGSGGGTGHGGAIGGAGGGRIQLAAVDLLIDGMVTANGLPGAASSLSDSDAASGGGGSGGSIQILASIIRGSGVVQANGGPGGAVPNPDHVERVFKMGGEGSGGRISIGSALRDPQVKIQARSGLRNVACRGSASQAGSVYEYAVDSQSCSAGEYAPLERFPPSHSCRKCEAGSFKNDTGRRLCTTCPCNSWSQRGSKRIEDCTCNAGYTTVQDNAVRPPPPSPPPPPPLPTPPPGLVRTVAGSQYGLAASIDGVGVGAFFHTPSDVVITPNGATALVADTGSATIRTINLATWRVQRLTQSFPSVQAMAFTPDGVTVLVAQDSCHGYFSRIKMIHLATEQVLSYAGGGGLASSYSSSLCYNSLSHGRNALGVQDGSGAYATFHRPAGIAVTPNGETAVIADESDHLVRAIHIESRQVSTLAGTKIGQVGVPGFQDGLSAKFDAPTDVAISRDGRTALVCDKNNHKIRAVDLATGVVSTLVGGTTFGYEDGFGTNAKLYYPVSIAVSPDGMLALVVDHYGTQGTRIRSINLETTRVETLAGSSASGHQDGLGAEVKFSSPRALAITPDGSRALIVDTGNNRIRTITLTPAPASPASPVPAQAPPTYQGQGFCVACQAGKFSRDGDAYCTDCPAGTYNTEIGSISAEACVACPEYSNSMAGSWKLTECICNAGYTSGNAQSCVPCAAGTFKSATGSLACTACPAGVYSPVGSTKVEDCASNCPTGHYKAAMGSERCAACPSFSNAEAASETVMDCKCNAGHSGPDGGPCTTCAAGKYKDAPGSSACTACASGTFSLPGSTNSSACVLCPKGTFSSVAASSCQHCAPGTYQPTEGASTPQVCLSCVAGKYSSAEGASSMSTCESCESGKYLSATGAVSEAACVACDAGTYSAQMGASACLVCPTNSHSVAGSVSLTSCECNAGYACANAVGDRCDACPGGKAKSDRGSSPCQLCPAGTYSQAAATACEVCPAESPLSPEGSAALVECRPPVVVKVVVTIALSMSEFTKDKEMQFVQGIADAVGVDVSNVKVTGVKAQSRRLLNSGIIVDVTISTPDKSAATSVAAQLTDDRINEQMAKVGLPEVVVAEEPEMSSVLPSSVQAASGSSTSAGKAVQTVSCRMIYFFAAEGSDMEEEETGQKVAGVWVSGTCVSGTWIAVLAGGVVLLCCCCCAGCYYPRYLRLRQQKANSRLEPLQDPNEIAMTSLPSAPDAHARGSRQPAGTLDDAEASRRSSQSAPPLPAPASHHSAAADEVQIEMVQMAQRIYQQGENTAPAQEDLREVASEGVLPSFPFETHNAYSSTSHTLPMPSESRSEGIGPARQETAETTAPGLPGSISRGQRHMLQHAADENLTNLPNIQPMEPMANEAPDVWAMLSASMPPVRSVPLQPGAQQLPPLQPQEPAATSAAFNPFSDEDYR